VPTVEYSNCADVLQSLALAVADWQSLIATLEFAIKIKSYTFDLPQL